MKIFITILILSSSLNLVAQTSREFAIVKEHIQPMTSNVVGKFSEHLGSITGSLFFVYKHVFSSQDYYSCNFTPSCSEYAVLCIQKQGLIKGLFNAFDRLTRCHGLSSSKYHPDPHTHLLVDPPHDAKFKEL